MKMNQQLATRLNPANPDHHLWDNHGTWWCHYTVHLADFTKQRIRHSLKTNDVAHAREIRDFLLAKLPGSDVSA